MIALGETGHVGLPRWAEAENPPPRTNVPATTVANPRESSTLPCFFPDHPAGHPIPDDGAGVGLCDQDETERILARIGEHRDDAGAGHPERIARCVRLLATRLGLSPAAVRMLGRASVLHDIGNVAIPDAILLKPGALTASEAAIMRTHVEHGMKLLAGCASPELHAAREIVATHHERWDGSGYPEGLEGDEIPLCGRIVAVADVFDALMHDRPDRAGLRLADAVARIAASAGTLFDPSVVKAFLTLDHAALLVEIARSSGIRPVAARPLRTLGLSGAAAALGVSASTVRRLADSGRVPCDRTAGGHRRFAISEVRAAMASVSSGAAPSVMSLAAPGDPLPAVAELLASHGPELVRLTAGVLYGGMPGWWTTGPALTHTNPWLRAVAGCAAAGDYATAIGATRRLMDQAEMAGTSRLERHRFLERFCDVVARRLPRSATTGHAGLRRLFAALQHSLLEDEPATRGGALAHAR
jgi:excisionase family DNA binding protein